MDSLNEFSEKVAHKLLEEFPEWEDDILDFDPDNEKEHLLAVVIEAPEGSRAERLVIQTTGTDNIWLRFAPPYFATTADDCDEMVMIIKKILADEMALAASFLNGEWTDSWLIGPGYKPEKKKGHIVRIISWNGGLDDEY